MTFQQSLLNIGLSLVLIASPVFINFTQAAEVTMGGQPVVLKGDLPANNMPAPEFKVVDDKFNPVNLSDFKGKTVLISAVPSLDTGVCALQTKRFNSEFANFDADVVMLTISTDLPFAQKRFCQTESVDKIKVLSDSVWRNFADQYGLLIESRGLLARAIFIIDANGQLQYQELVKEVGSHPDYDAAIAALTKIAAAKS
ncbi:thiol peroxidase [Shewanella glacialimarina]|uniref:thiol peroxidase n=1 Tax=Shewanella glacialimarina TaxID=2590884 RepID=UPI001CF826FE|nr:thiol peroxidase [Shewanella glacialimarina]UCX05259.1 thiol peroxidase [Shewanella glacialimarina]